MVSKRSQRRQHLWLQACNAVAYRLPG